MKIKRVVKTETTEIIEVYPGQTFKEGEQFFQIIGENEILVVDTTPCFCMIIGRFYDHQKPVPCSNHEFTHALQQFRAKLAELERAGLTALHKSVKDGTALQVVEANNQKAE